MRNIEKIINNKQGSRKLNRVGNYKNQTKWQNKNKYNQRQL